MIYRRTEDRRDKPDTATPMVGKQQYSAMTDKNTGNDSERKQHFLQHKEKHSNR